MTGQDDDDVPIADEWDKLGDRFRHDIGWAKLKARVSRRLDRLIASSHPPASKTRIAWIDMFDKIFEHPIFAPLPLADKAARGKANAKARAAAKARAKAKAAGKLSNPKGPKPAPVDRITAVREVVDGVGQRRNSPARPHVSSHLKCMWDALRTVERAHAKAQTKIRKGLQREYDPDSGLTLPVAEFWLKDPDALARANAKRRRLIDVYLGRDAQQPSSRKELTNEETGEWIKKAKGHRKDVKEAVAAAHKLP